MKNEEKEYDLQFKFFIATIGIAGILSVGLMFAAVYKFW